MLLIMELDNKRNQEAHVEEARDGSEIMELVSWEEDTGKERKKYLKSQIYKERCTVKKQAWTNGTIKNTWIPPWKNI